MLRFVTGRLVCGENRLVSCFKLIQYDLYAGTRLWLYDMRDSTQDFREAPYCL